jgi:hypothetical protein
MNQWALDHNLVDNYNIDQIDFSDFKTDSQFLAVNIVLFILCFLSFASLFAAGMTDPGIIPR